MIQRGSADLEIASTDLAHVQAAAVRPEELGDSPIVGVVRLERPWATASIRLQVGQETLCKLREAVRAVRPLRRHWLSSLLAPGTNWVLELGGHFRECELGV